MTLNKSETQIYRADNSRAVETYCNTLAVLINNKTFNRRGLFADTYSLLGIIPLSRLHCAQQAIFVIGFHLFLAVFGFDILKVN